MAQEYVRTVCIVCGTELTPVQQKRNQSFCSRKHAFMETRQRAWNTKGRNTRKYRSRYRRAIRKTTAFLKGREVTDDEFIKLVSGYANDELLAEATKK